MWIYLDLKTKVKETLTSRKRTRCNAPLCRLKKESISVSNPTLFLVLSFLTDSWEDNADSWRRASHINECLPSFGDIPKAKEDTWEMQDEASENSQSNRWKQCRNLAILEFQKSQLIFCQQLTEAQSSVYICTGRYCFHFYTLPVPAAWITAMHYKPLSFL